MDKTANCACLSKRIAACQNLLIKEECDALLVQDQINLFYLSGLFLSAGKLIVHKEGASLIVDGRYFESCKQNSKIPVYLAENGTLAKVIQEIGTIKTLGFNSHLVTYSNFLALEKEIETLSSLSLVPLEGPVEALRKIKGPEEIQTLKEASALGLEGFDFLLTLIKEGVSEAELAIELEIFWKRRGGKTVAFDPIIAFGAASSMPHYRSGAQKLKKNQSILLDIGVNFHHYHSDMTRMVYYGTPDPKMLSIHEIVLEAKREALKLCKPGTLASDLDRKAREVIGSHGYADRFTHSLGHGVGLEIHEAPTLRDKAPAGNEVLSPGMVVTIEPGIYIPGVGGVRLEDTIVITESGYENLTNRPDTPIILDI